MRLISQRMHVFFVLFLFSVLPKFADAQANQGVLVVGEGQCSQPVIIVIDALVGYIVADVYQGIFNRGSQVSGNLSRFGMVNVRVDGRQGRVFINDLLLSEREAARQCWR